MGAMGERVVNVTEQRVLRLRFSKNSTKTIHEEHEGNHARELASLFLGRFWSLDVIYV
jgi:hypothetical protein